MRNDFAIGPWLAAGAAIFLSVVGCTVPLLQGKSGNNHNIALASPSPSPSLSPSPSPSPSASLQPFGVTGPAFHAGEVGLVYTPVTYTAAGGVAPYAWKVATGALPPGLTLNNGTVSGKPTGSGTYTSTIEVVDSGPDKFDLPVSITVASALNASLIPSCAKACNVELGCVNACGSFGAQTGGIGPFTYQLTQGQLPAGTSLSALSLVGTFTGLTGYLQFTVQVTDSLGATADVSPKFWMYPHLSLNGGGIPTSASNACFAINAPAGGCTASFQFIGGTPNGGLPSASASWNSVSCPTAPLPTITVGSGQITIAVNGGLRQNCNGWKGILSVVLTNADVCSPGVHCAAPAEYQISVLGT